MSAEHSPRPWSQFHGSIYASETAPVHAGKTCIEIGHDPTECGRAVVNVLTRALLDDVKAGHWDDVTDPSPADLALITAAPDLLAVVQDLLESAEYWSEYDVPIGIVDRMRGAVAKAAGGEP